jgi:hypothetical protein
LFSNCHQALPQKRHRGCYRCYVRGSVRSKFSTILKDIADKAYYLKNIAEAHNIRQLSQTNAELARRLEGLTMAHANMERWEIFLPCHFLPFDHNPGFYGWQSILERTRDALADKDADKRIKLVVFWGTGGIGKSQIALEYASQQGSEGVPIIIWISSEKETEVASSFNKVAQKMKLPGVLPSNTPDRNRDLVLEYLQRTGKLLDKHIWQCSDIVQTNCPRNQMATNFRQR